MPSAKFIKEGNNKKLVKMNKDKSFIDKALGDISKSSATKQIILGSTSGWLLGFMSSKIGKVVAIAVGGGIILLQVANQQGIIKINWNKVNRKIDKITDKVEEKIAGEAPNWMDKMERYVDRTLDKAEDNLKGQKSKAKRWYSSYTGNSECKLKEIHIFVISFVAGLSIGIATA